MRGRLILCGSIAVLLVGFLSGCGGGGGRKPQEMATGDYTRAGVTEEDQAFDLVQAAVKRSWGGGYQGLTGTASNWMVSIAPSMESCALDPLYRAPSAISEVSFSAFRLAHRSANKPTRSRSYDQFPVDEDGDGGWHWTGSKGDDCYGHDNIFSLVGTKPSVGTITITSSATGEYDSSKTTTSISITRPDGKLYEEESESHYREDTWSTSLCRKLDGKVIDSAYISGSFHQQNNNDYPFVDSWSGRESIVAEDGYWVNVHYDNWQMESSPIPEEMRPSGTMTFVGSDGFSGTIKLAKTGAYTGEVKNAAGVKVADIAGMCASMMPARDPQMTVTCLGKAPREIDFGE